MPGIVFISEAPPECLKRIMTLGSNFPKCSSCPICLKAQIAEMYRLIPV